MGPRAALQWFDYERLRAALLWTNVALFAARRAEFERCDVSPSEILAIPLFTVALHRVMVALKYATLASRSGMKLRPRPFSLRYAMLTASEARRFFACEDARTAMQWLMDMQLVTGWLPAHKELQCVVRYGLAVTVHGQPCL